MFIRPNTDAAWMASVRERERETETGGGGQMGKALGNSWFLRPTEVSL